MSKKVLIVDDSEFQRKEYQKMFSELSLTCYEAENGVEALKRQSSDGPFDLIITDLYMPEKSGLEFIEDLKEVEPDLSSTLVIVSSTCSKDLKLKAKDLGVKAWITKPYEEKTFLAYLTKLLSD